MTKSHLTTVCERIRAAVSDQGGAVNVSALLTNKEGQQVLRMRPAQCGTHKILETVRSIAPLAQVAARTSEIDGCDEVELYLPTYKQLMTKARSNATLEFVPWALWKSAQALIAIAIGIAGSTWIPYVWNINASTPR